MQTKALPYPFTSKELFEQSMRMPIGSESNPETAIRALNRPEVSCSIFQKEKEKEKRFPNTSYISLGVGGVV